MPSEWEYIVVGSCAGGETVAARLAEAGKTVLLLQPGGDPIQPHEEQLSEDNDSLHPFASENGAMKRGSLVRHYENEAIQRARNAMIFVYPHDVDWDSIAALTGDSSWNADTMRCYFDRLENCHHRHVYRRLARLGINPTRHRWDGWLQTERAIPITALAESDLRKVLLASIGQAIQDIGEVEEQAGWFLESLLEPNDWRTKENAIGLRSMPLTMRNHARIGTRERLREVASRNPDRLCIEPNALVTRVLLDENQRAVGVEYLCGERPYRAHTSTNLKTGELRQARATREVILSGGAFNTPQLLMLSGIGPAEEMRRHGIAVKVDLRGVGKNLQDRYEISVVNRMNFEKWERFEGASFDSSDPQYRRRKEKRDAHIITNSPVLSLKRSTKQAPLPDLFCLAFLGRVEDSSSNSSGWFAQNLNYLTWTVLKAHTNNRAGEVTLRSADPRDTPQVNFHSFKESTPDGSEDMAAVVDGLRFVRRISDILIERGLLAEEELPGRALQSDEELSEYIHHNAWGHHASCSCPIGPREQGGVLNSNFRVHGVHGLRVVDASVFPRMPGFFISSAVYMIGEKAADVILADAKNL